MAEWSGVVVPMNCQAAPRRTAPAYGKGTLFLPGASFAMATPAIAATLRCDIASKFLCQSAGCSTATASVWNLIDMDAKTYSRCDRSGCDTYDAVFSPSGVFLNIALPANGLIAKLEPGTGSFSEVASLAGEVYVSFGVCRDE
jgi:hypothetical protein